MQDVIRRTFAASINAKERFVVEHGETLERVARLMAEALQQGHKILLFGNGGSAADAQHIAAEFVNRFVIERRPLPALALTTDTSALTSIGNDYGFEQIFSKQIEALGAAGDVAIAISTSGNSPNVLRAIEACGKVGCFVVGLTGGDGGKMKDQVDFLLNVSATRQRQRSRPKAPKTRPSGRKCVRCSMWRRLPPFIQRIDSTFHESSYGFSTFNEMLASMGDLVEVRRGEFDHELRLRPVMSEPAA